MTAVALMPPAPEVGTVKEKRKRTKHTRTFTGCINCKSKRRKCDEGKPSCGTCSKMGQSCSYAAPKISIFKAESYKPPRDRSKSSSKSASPSFSFDSSTYSPLLQFREEDSIWSHTSDDDTEGSTSELMIVPTLKHSDWYAGFPGMRQLGLLSSMQLKIETFAVRLFLDRHPQMQVLCGGRKAVGPPNVIPHLAQASESSPLYPAAEAFALISLAQVQKDVSMLRAGMRAYSRSLMAMSRSLQDDGVETNPIDRLSAGILLGYYELMMPQSAGPLVRGYDRHIRGLRAILEALPLTSLVEPRNEDVVNAVRWQMMYHSLQDGENRSDNSKWVWDLSRFHVSDETERNLQSMQLEAIELRAESKRLHEYEGPWKQDPFSQDVQDATIELVRRVDLLLANMRNWEANLPKHWQYQTVPADIDPHDDDLETSDIWPGDIRWYPDLNVAAKVQLCALMKLYCCSTIHKATKWLWHNQRPGLELFDKQALQWRILGCHAGAIEVADAIAASIPFCHGVEDVSKLPPHLHWLADPESPRVGFAFSWMFLAEIARYENLPRGQRAWFLNQMRRTSLKTGLPKPEWIDVLAGIQNLFSGGRFFMEANFYELQTDAAGDTRTFRQTEWYSKDISDFIEMVRSSE